MFPDAILPALSRKNQARTPARTDFRTSSGALSKASERRTQMQTPQPNKNPPDSADKNLVAGSLKVRLPSGGKLNRSSVNLAGSEKECMLPRKKTGPNEAITIAVILRYDLCV